MVESKPGRLYHMDAVRCFCMLYGLMVHGATIGDNLAFSVIKESSNLFRMAAFFLVSGYFSAMVLTRTDTAAFLRNRMRILVVPFVAGVVLLNPITLFLVQKYHGGVGWSTWWGGAWLLPAPGPGIWHLHLWFLISLAAYALLTPAMLKIWRLAIVEQGLRWIAARPATVGLGLLSLVTIGIVLCARTIYDQLLGPFVPPAAEFITQVSFGYLAYFAIGVAAFAVQPIYRLIHHGFWAGVLVYGGLFLAHPLFADAVPRAVERTAYWSAKAGLIFSIITCLLWLAEKTVKKSSPFLTELTDGVYSFYIFHYMMIYILASLVATFTDQTAISFLLILLIGYPLLFWIHRHLIVPFPLMRFLFNGKPLTPRRVARV